MRPSKRVAIETHKSFDKLLLFSTIDKGGYFKNVINQLYEVNRK